jgi:hypothetical protein
MLGADREAGKAEAAQHLAHRTLVQANIEAGLDQRLQVNPSPAYDPVPFRVRSSLHLRRQLGLLLGCQPRLRAGTPPVVEASPSSL